MLSAAIFKAQHSHFLKCFSCTKKCSPTYFILSKDAERRRRKTGGCQQPAEGWPRMPHGNKNYFIVNIRHFSESMHRKPTLLLRPNWGKHLKVLVEGLAKRLGSDGHQDSPSPSFKSLGGTSLESSLGMASTWQVQVWEHRANPLASNLGSPMTLKGRLAMNGHCEVGRGLTVQLIAIGYTILLKC